MAQSIQRKSSSKGVAEIANVVGTSVAILAVVGAGSAIVAAMPDLGPAGFAAAYLGPGALAYAVYWWVAQKL